MSKSNRKAKQLYHESLAKSAVLNDWSTNPEKATTKEAKLFSDGTWATQGPMGTTEDSITRIQMTTQVRKINVSKAMITLNWQLRSHESKTVKLPKSSDLQMSSPAPKGTHEQEVIKDNLVLDGMVKLKNDNDTMVSNDRKSTFGSLNSNGNSLYDGKSVVDESSQPNDSTVFEKKMTGKPNRIRHSNRIKLTTRYGHFWVLAENTFRRQFDSLASGIIG